MEKSSAVIRDWTLLWGMVLVVLATLGLARKAITWINAQGLGWVLREGSLIVLAVLVAALLGYLVFVARARNPWTYLAFGFLALIYALLLWKLSRAPAERIHLLEYGLIGILAHRAVGHHADEPGRTLLAILVTLNIGLVDELVQGLLPTRYYDTIDILVNTASGMLGVASAMLAGRADPDRGLTGWRRARPRGS